MSRTTLTRHIVLDTETTGLDPNQDKIVEIGAVELQDLRPTGRTYHQYVNPGRPVPPEATEVHGLTDAFLADKPPIAAISDDFLAFLQDSPLIAHNAAFDVGFLTAALGPLPNPIIDSLAIAKRKHPMGPNSLDALCRRYGIDTSRRTKHGALLDAEILAAVYVELVSERQPTLELSTVVAVTDVVVVRQRTAPLPARLTEEDLAAHAAMVSGIPGALWLRMT